MKLNQQNKNIALIIVLVVLVASCFWASQFNPYQNTVSETELPAFKVTDATNRLTKVVFKGPKVANELVKTNTGWTVNDSLSLDPAMQQVLMALLEQVEVQRAVDGSLADDIVKQVLDSGIQVQLYTDNEILEEFVVGGNPKMVNSYFVQNGKAYLMQLPGYESYVAGMFEVKTLDWKNRSIFNGTWQDIVSLSLNYPNGDSLYFQYEKGLIKLQNKMQADSVKVMDYVETYNYFYVDQFLPANHEAVQQVADFEPAGSIIIEALDKQKNLKMAFYSHPDFNAILVHINNKDWAGIQKNRFLQYFPVPDQFLKD